MTPSGHQQLGHQVAITGIGLVSPAGLGLAAAKARLAQGPLTPTLPTGDEAALTAPLIHAVPDFDARPYLRRRKDRKLMARANQLAVVAARLAVEDAGESLGDLTDAGLYLGVGREPGTIDDVLPALAHSGSQAGTHIDIQRLSEEGMRWMNPLSSLKTLPNMSLAHVAIVLGTMGPGLALCDGPNSGTRALLEGATAIAEGRIDMALAGGADSRTAFTDRTTALRQARSGSSGSSGSSPSADGGVGPMGEAAAVFVLERFDRAQARGARIYGCIGRGEGDTLTQVDWGDCGAATTVASLAMQLADGPVTVDGMRIERPDSPPKAPALRTRSTMPVAITGIGMRTPLGNDFKGFARRLMAGESAVGPIKGFDATHFPVKNACEAQCGALPLALAAALAGLDDRKAQFAVGAALDAVADHGATPDGAGLLGSGL
ncbi:MAG: 3-oxoacyl-[acyl-carrier-protein] synthase II, partial [Bradymonadia bacterium]